MSKSQKIILRIDTTSNEIITVSLVKDKLTKKLQRKIWQNKSQHLLPLISKILIETKTNLNQLTEVEVNPGPGSFTGTRVGVSVANVLSWVLNIPVNGKKQVVPRYGPSWFDANS